MEKSLPWITNRFDTSLKNIVNEYKIAPAKVFEIGCGYGDNSIWLAKQGFEVTAIDLSEEAIRYAIDNAKKEGVDCKFLVQDFLKDPLEKDYFEFVFDRGCFHSRDFKGKRKSFAKTVSLILKEGGLWLSLIGSKDTPETDIGPPKLSAMEIIKGVEQNFKIINLKASVFDSDQKESSKAWSCLMEKR